MKLEWLKFLLEKNVVTSLLSSCHWRSFWKIQKWQMPKNSRQALFKGWERHLNPLAMKAYEEYYKLAKEHDMTMVQLAQAFVNTRPL